MSFKVIPSTDRLTKGSVLNQLVDVIQEDVSGSATRRKYQVFVTGGIGPGVTSSLFQTVYDQDFSLQTANPIVDVTVGLFTGSMTVTSSNLAGAPLQDQAGKYLFAWLPKSSELNERTTIVVENKKTGPILLRQIAGAVAKRIILYAKKGEQCSQGDDMGFIKFGSRVDLFLPLDSKINIKMNDIVKGGKTLIASIET